MAVLENLDVGVLGRILLKAVGNLDWAMMRVCMTDKSADEAYQDVGRAFGSNINCSSFGTAQHGSARERDQKREKENPGSGETRHAELLTHHEMTLRREEMRPKISQLGAGS